MNSKEKKDAISKRVNNMFPTQREKLLAYETVLGAGAMLTQYFMDNAIKDKKFDCIPIAIKYSASLIASHMFSISSNGKINILDVSDFSFENDEQNEEAMFRKMKFLIEHLYHWIQEEEKI